MFVFADKLILYFSKFHFAVFYWTIHFVLIVFQFLTLLDSLKGTSIEPSFCCSSCLISMHLANSNIITLQYFIELKRRTSQRLLYNTKQPFSWQAWNLREYRIFLCDQLVSQFLNRSSNHKADIENQYHIQDLLDSFKGILCLQHKEKFIRFKQKGVKNVSSS